MHLTRSFGALRRRGSLAEPPREDDEEKVRLERGAGADAESDAKVNTGHGDADEDGGTRAAA